MTRSRLAAAVLMLTLAGAPLRAHDVFHFVGYVLSWDAKRNAVDVLTQEEWDGKMGEYTRHIVLRPDCRVMRLSKEVKRSELKPGVGVIVEAAGVDITDLEGVEIEISYVPPAKKKK